jgi:hypothetical protein
MLLTRTLQQNPMPNKMTIGELCLFFESSHNFLTLFSVHSYTWCQCFKAFLLDYVSIERQELGILTDGSK